MTVIETEETYLHCVAQMQRQIPERDALNEVIEDITKAIEVWEEAHPKED